MCNFEEIICRFLEVLNIESIRTVMAISKLYSSFIQDIQVGFNHILSVLWVFKEKNTAAQHFCEDLAFGRGMISLAFLSDFMRDFYYFSYFFNDLICTFYFICKGWKQDIKFLAIFDKILASV